MKVNLDVVLNACNHSTWEAEARELGVPGQFGLHSKTHSQKVKQQNYKGLKVWFSGRACA
jgi:hypothetical protein